MEPGEPFMAGLPVSARRFGGAGVIVDVCLSRMFLVGVLVGLVSVRQSRMVVLVLVRGHQVGDVLVRPVVMGDVDMLVRMDLGIVTMGCRHAASSLRRVWVAASKSSLVLASILRS